jgi:hypothetical protein
VSLLSLPVSRSFETADFARLAESINKRCNDFLPHKVGKYSAPLKVVYLNYLSQAGRENVANWPYYKTINYSFKQEDSGQSCYVNVFPHMKQSCIL